MLLRAGMAVCLQVPVNSTLGLTTFMLLAAIRLIVIAYVACCAAALLAVWYRKST